MFSASLRSFARLGRDETAAVAIVAAGLVFVVFGFAAAAVDLGSAYWVKRNLQAAADAAAQAGALDPSRAAAIVAQSTASNGVPATASVTIQSGTYTGDPTLPEASRFSPGGANADALRVTIAMPAPVYFLGLFHHGTLPVSVAATATDIPEGSFSAGTGVAALNAGLLNSLLGGLLGASVSLSLADYQALAQTDISLLSFSDALASRLKLTGGTYGNLLASTMTMGDLLAAAESVAGNSDDVQAVTALSSLGTGMVDSDSLALSSLLDLGDWDLRQVGSLNGAIESAPGVNLLDMIMLGAQTVAGGHLITFTLPASIAGVSAASLTLAIGEPAQNAPRIGLGPVGISIHTAQMRLYFDFTLLPLAGLSTGVVQLPLYLEAAQGTATMSAITCGSDPESDAQMTITGAPGLAAADIAAVNTSQMTNFSTPVSLGAATVLNVAPVLTATALITANLSAPSPTDVEFSFDDIADTTVKTVTTTDVTAGLLDSLSSGLSAPGGLTVKVLGLPLLPVGIVTSELSTALKGVLSAADPVINSVLTSLGVELGTMALRATGMRCGIPVIVQ